MEKTIIIIDGPRGAGKTTTAESLVKFLEDNGISAQYHKKGKRSNKNEFKNIVSHLVDFQGMRSKVIVVDRFLATELAMSFAHEREDPMTLVKWSMMCSALFEEYNVKQYVLLPSTDELTIRLAQRRDKNVATIDAAVKILEQDFEAYEWRGHDMQPEIIQDVWETATKLSESELLNSGLMTQEEIIERIYEDIKNADKSIA